MGVSHFLQYAVGFLPIVGHGGGIQQYTPCIRWFHSSSRCPGQEAGLEHSGISERYMKTKIDALHFRHVSPCAKPILWQLINSEVSAINRPHVNDVTVIKLKSPSSFVLLNIFVSSDIKDGDHRAHGL